MPDKHYRRKEDVKSCPFCGGDKLQKNSHDDNAHSHGKASVFCLTCAASCRGNNIDEAVISWNRRA